MTVLNYVIHCKIFRLGNTNNARHCHLNFCIASWVIGYNQDSLFVKGAEANNFIYAEVKYQTTTGKRIILYAVASAYRNYKLKLKRYSRMSRWCRHIHPSRSNIFWVLLGERFTKLDIRVFMYLHILSFGKLSLGYSILCDSENVSDLRYHNFARDINLPSELDMQLMLFFFLY